MCFSEQDSANKFRACPRCKFNASARLRRKSDGETLFHAFRHASRERQSEFAIFCSSAINIFRSTSFSRSTHTHILQHKTYTASLPLLVNNNNFAAQSRPSTFIAAKCIIARASLLRARYVGGISDRKSCTCRTNAPPCSAPALDQFSSYGVFTIF